MSRRLFFALGALALAAGGYAWWVFHKPHEDIRKMAVEATFSAGSLIAAFTEDADAADARLFDRVIRLNGTVSKVEAWSDRALVTFDDGGDFVILAYLPGDGNAISELSKGSAVALRGRYSGYVVNDADFFIPADIKLEPCYIED